MVAAGKCYGPRCMAENTPLWPCWYLLARFYVHAMKKGPWNQTSLVLTRHASREGQSLSRRSRVHLSRPLFFFSFPASPTILHFLFFLRKSGNVSIIPTFAKPNHLFVIICAIYLTVYIQIVWLNPEKLQLRIRGKIK